MRPLPPELEDRILAAGLDPETAGKRIIDIATRHGLGVELIVGIIERYRRTVAERETRPLALTMPVEDAFSGIQDFVLPAPPGLEMPLTPPPRRSSKRAQRARERAWSR